MASPVDSGSFRSDDGRVEVVFDPDEALNAKITDSKIKLVMQAAVAALNAEHTGGPDHLTVLITGDERIRELNGRFKGEDGVTDVLSFNASGGSADGEFEDGAWPEFPETGQVGETGDTASNRLGDIVISLVQVERQAIENGKPPGRELAMLTVHGVLHLLGYDHAEPGEEKIMFGKTDAVLAGIFGD